MVVVVDVPTLMFVFEVFTRSVHFFFKPGNYVTVIRACATINMYLFVILLPVFVVVIIFCCRGLYLFMIILSVKQKGAGAGVKEE